MAVSSVHLVRAGNIHLIDRNRGVHAWNSLSVDSRDYSLGKF